MTSSDCQNEHHYWEYNAFKKCHSRDVVLYLTYIFLTWDALSFAENERQGQWVPQFCLLLLENCCAFSRPHNRWIIHCIKSNLKIYIVFVCFKSTVPHYLGCFCSQFLPHFSTKMFWSKYFSPQSFDFLQLWSFVCIQLLSLA